ncbi:MAG TPA: hypothetical protein VJG30_03865 [Candidatus Nanoarchaeia archaeon]|nr:hypothetical protein [Candidatus Nanoarchaeia archaeon]
MDILALLLQVIALITAVLATYYAYIMYSCNKFSWPWRLIALALLLTVFRRILGLLDIIFKLEGLSDFLVVIDRPFLPVVFSIFICIALWRLKRNFQELADEKRRFNQEWVCFSKKKK